MLTYYTLSIRGTTVKQQITAPPLLQLHSTGSILDAPNKFRVDSIIYTLKKRPVVINLSPHIVINLLVKAAQENQKLLKLLFILLEIIKEK